ncbi:MAG: hypothetical protein GPJ54_18885 [Candidatus Heimdallarchaeota archaeon]|nr:hypothetical protein [Candidatus Heimdallarchaeota archaeon]
MNLIRNGSLILLLQNIMIPTYLISQEIGSWEMRRFFHFSLVPSVLLLDLIGFSLIIRGLAELEDLDPKIEHKVHTFVNSISYWIMFRVLAMLLIVGMIWNDSTGDEFELGKLVAVFLVVSALAFFISGMQGLDKIYQWYTSVMLVGSFLFLWGVFTIREASEDGDIYWSMFFFIGGFMRFFLTPLFGIMALRSIYIKGFDALQVQTSSV